MRRRVTFSRNFTLSLSRTLPVLLQVLRVRDAPAAPALARRGRASCSTTPRAGASRSCSSSPASGPRTTPSCASAWPSRATRTSPPTSSGRASGRSSAGCCRTRTSASWAARPRAPARGDGVAGADARVDQRPTSSPTRARRRSTRRAAGDDPRRRRAADPVHERDPRRHRRDRGGPDRLAGGARRGARRVRAPAGGDPAELRPARALLRRGAGGDRRRRGGGVTGRRGCPTARSCRCPTGRRRGRRSRT